MMRSTNAKSHHQAAGRRPEGPGGRQGRRLPGAVLVLCLAGLGSCNGVQTPDPARPLRDLAEVWKLTPAQARRGYPVDIHGRVTFFDPQLELFTIQDRSAGIYVEIASAPTDLTTGQLVNVRGFTGYEASTPVIVKPVIQTQPGQAQLEPVRRAPGEILAGRAEYQWTETEARLLARSSIDNEHVRYRLLLGRQTIDCIVLSESPPILDALVGSDVVVRGVPVTVRTISGQTQRIEMYVASSGDIYSKRGAAASGTSEPPPHMATPGLSLVTTAGELKRLARGTTDRFYPVRMRGVITLVQPRWSGIIVQDATAAVYVAVADEMVHKLRISELVEVQGVGLSGNYAPSIESSSVRVIGRAALPAAIPFAPQGLMGSGENVRMRVCGVVRAVAKWEDEGLTLNVASDGGLVPVRIVTPDANRRLEALIDAEISVEGVGSPLFDQRNRIYGFQLVAQNSDAIRVTKAAGLDAFAGPSTAIGSILRFNPEGPPSHRLKVAGTVVLSRSGLVYLADETGGVRLSTRQSAEVRPGDSVEAVGFPPVQRYKLVLEETVLRKVGRGRVPSPEEITVDQATGGPFEARLVRLNAFLLSRRTSFGDRRLTLQAGRKQFSAILEQPWSSAILDSLQDGSMLQLTGVCAVDWDETVSPPRPISFHLLIPSEADIRVLQSASWWTLGRALTILGFMSAVVLVVLAWVAVLRRRVAAQTEQICERVEREARLQTRLEEAERLESLGRLAGGVAHDFNNLLTVINGYADLLLVKTGLTESCRKKVDEIRNAGRKAASLTGQLLAFSRKQVLQPRMLDLNQVVRETEAMLRRLIGENILLEVSLDPSACTVLADPGQLTQVLMNLSVNARDAMPGGGTLTISTYRAELGGRTSGRDWHPEGPGEGPAPGRYVLLSVVDTGSGMDEFTRAHIFEPFFTTKDLGKGTGLGLSTVFGIVRQSRGYIRVQSAPGKGSQFTICMPRVEAGVESAAVEPAGVEPPANGREETILIVEDQAEVRALVRRVLRECGYMILEASGGDESLELLRGYAEPIRLMITDVVMPGMTGVRLADEAKRIRPETKVLFMSGYTHTEFGLEGVLREGVEFIQKPFTPESLAAKVRAVLV